MLTYEGILLSSELGFSTSIWKNVQWNKVGSISIWGNSSFLWGNCSFWKSPLWAFPLTSAFPVGHKQIWFPLRKYAKGASLRVAGPGLAFLRKLSVRQEKEKPPSGCRRVTHFFLLSFIIPSSYWAVYKAEGQEVQTQKFSFQMGNPLNFPTFHILCLFKGWVFCWTCPFLFFSWVESTFIFFHEGDWLGLFNNHSFTGRTTGTENVYICILFCCALSSIAVSLFWKVIQP